jgi:NAD(P)H dehydrogenase (quinone)
MKFNSLLTLFFILNSAHSFGKKAMNETNILVLYDSTNNGTALLAKAISEGSQNEANTNVVVKKIEHTKPGELLNYDGIAFGSPVYFGSMSSKMKSFLDQTLPLWSERKLSSIPASVFMSAGSGLGKEAAILSIWSVLASHGMILISNGSLGMNNSDKSIAHGFTPFGITALAGEHSNGLPSKDELNTARLQGQLLAKTARALKKDRETCAELPEAPKAVGNYQTYRISGKNVYINQIALKDGKVLFPGQIGNSVNIDEAKEASKQTALNIISVLKDALGGDLSKVKSVIQLTGYFNTSNGFSDHAQIMDEASKTMIQFFGEQGKHARAAVGSPSLPLNSTVEIQAIFELK